jgi:Uma2 family endonuclease
MPSRSKSHHGPVRDPPGHPNEVQPDVLVARYSDLTQKDLPRAPLLAVEVISPCSRLPDASLKKAFYARLGARSYWLVDPVKPALTALELASDGYAEVGYVAGDQSWQASQPFTVTITPAALVRGCQP